MRPDKAFAPGLCAIASGFCADKPNACTSFNVETPSLFAIILHSKANKLGSSACLIQGLATAVRWLQAEAAAGPEQGHRRRRDDDDDDEGGDSSTTSRETRSQRSSATKTREEAKSPGRTEPRRTQRQRQKTKTNNMSTAFVPSSTAYAPNANAFVPNANAFAPTAMAFAPNVTAFAPSSTALTPSARSGRRATYDEKQYEYWLNYLARRKKVQDGEDLLFLYFYDTHEPGWYISKEIGRVPVACKSERSV